MKYSRFVPCFVLISALALAATPPANFAQGVLYPTNGFTASWIAVKDVNGDGKPDLVVLNGCDSVPTCTTGTAAVLLGNGDGTFQPAVTYSTGAPSGGLAVIDTNGDNILDIVAGTANGIAVLLGNGDGTFQSAKVSAFSDIHGLATADIDGDGIQDAVVTTGSGIAVLFGKGDGSFQNPVITTTTIDGTALAVGDLDGDGKLDVVIITSQGDGNRGHQHRVDGTYGVLFGNGNGTFRISSSFDTLGFYPQGFAIADMNRDSLPDLLVVNGLGHVNMSMGSVGEIFNEGGGNFFGTVVNPLGVHAYGVAAGDINGDGIEDMVVVEGGNLAVVLTNGEIRHHGAYGPVAVAIADVNGDGMPDLISASCSSCEGKATVILAKPLKTKVTVTTSGSPSQSGQAVTFTVSTSSLRGPVPNGQTITFLNGMKEIGTGTVTGGVATLTTSALTSGTHTIKAKFGGCPFFKAASGTVKQVVNP